MTSYVDQHRALIRELLKAEGVTQAELAKRLGISQKHMSQVITGRAGLSFDLVERAIAALGWKVARARVTKRRLPEHRLT